MCNYCNVPETEMHHVMQCTKFDNLRNRLFDVCRKEIYKFDTLRNERKFCKIMQVTTIDLANALGKFLIDAVNAIS